MQFENKTKICFVAQFPPPIHGLSKAVETLYNSTLSDSFELERIDITENKRILKTVVSILKSHADLFYFTISQSVWGNLRDLVILKLFELKRKKVIVHLHGGYYRRLVDNDLKRFQKTMNYKAMSKVNAVVVLGPSLRYIFDGMVQEDKIYSVPNCIDDEFLLNNDEFAKKVKRIKDESIYHVLWLSNFIYSKGFQTVLEMAKHEKERVESGFEKKYHFDFAGEFLSNKEKNYFNNYIEKNSLEDYVSYHGIALGDKKRELLKRGVFFALPTRYHKEGQPISILEAMGNGMVILTTNHAGIPDLVENVKSGEIHTKNNELYNLTCFTQDRICETIIFNRDKVLTNFTQKHYVERMKTIFYKVTV